MPEKKPEKEKERLRIPREKKIENLLQFLAHIACSRKEHEPVIESMRGFHSAVYIAQHFGLFPEGQYQSPAGYVPHVEGLNSDIEYLSGADPLHMNDGFLVEITSRGHFASQRFGKYISQSFREKGGLADLIAKQDDTVLEDLATILIISKIDGVNVTDPKLIKRVGVYNPSMLENHKRGYKKAIELYQEMKKMVGR